MHLGWIRGMRLVLAVGASLCLLAASAGAGDRPWEQERWSTIYMGFDSSGDDPFVGQQWLKLQPLKYDRHGSEYDRSLSLNLEENFTFTIQSPPAGEWAPGVAFELRF